MLTARKLPDHSHVLLAPPGASIPASLQPCWTQVALRDRLMGEMQRFRGRVYLEDGVVSASSLTADGRYVSALDGRSWHLVAKDGNGCVAGCARMLVHSASAAFDDLYASFSGIARSPQWGKALRETVESELNLARRRGFSFCEVGGWAIREDVRCSPHSVRLALGVLAFGQLIGGAIALTTATLRNQAASILNRVGGRHLVCDGSVIPNYFEPQYGCEMALLRFDSQTFEPKYRSALAQLRTALESAPVLCANDTGMVSAWQDRTINELERSLSIAAIAQRC